VHAILNWDGLVRVEVVFPATVIDQQDNEFSGSGSPEDVPQIRVSAQSFLRLILPAVGGPAMIFT